MSEAEDDDFAKYFRLLPIAIGVAVIAFLATRPAHKPAPSNSSVFGCYVAPNAPAILLDAEGVHILQDGFPRIPFHIERQKTGLDLTADAPIRADPTQQGYRFAIDRRGIGRFMPFYRVQDGKTYGIFDGVELKGFQMLASDGTTLNYGPAQPERCESR